MDYGPARGAAEMAVSPKDMQDSNAGKAATFSYAQAAKGKAQIPSAALKPVEAQEKESTSWADDLGDADTVLEEHQHNGTTNGTSESSEASVKSATTPSQADTAETSATASNVSTPEYDSAATTVKDEGSKSPVGSQPTLAEGQQEQQKEADTLGKTRSDSEERSSEANISRKESVSEEPKRMMKEAPPPAVNFWAARMAEASKNRPGHTAQSRPAASAKRNGALSNGVSASAGGRPSRPESMSQRPSELSQQGKDAALPRGGKSRPSPTTRAPQGGVPTRTTPLPPTGDSTSWPTPLTAQDTERQKDQSRGPKADDERKGSVTSKSTSKNDWKKLEFTPSVVFESNVPAGGRGVPAGVRGGRGGSISKRGGRLAPGVVPVADKADQETRSTQPPPSKRLASPSKARNGVPMSEPSRRTATAVTASTTNGHVEPEPSNPEEKRAAAPSQELPSKPSAEPVGATEAVVSDIQEQAQNGTPASALATSQPEPSVSRRGSLAPGADVESDHTTFADRRRIAQTEVGRGGLDHTSKRGKRTTPPQSRSRAQSQGYESHPFAGTLPYRGRGGRGGRGRGRGDFSASVQGSLASLHTGAANAKGAYPYMQSFSASPNQTRSWRASQRGSVPNDASLTHSGRGYGANDAYAMYPAGAYGYPGPPMSAIPYGAQMDPFIVSSAIEHQL